MKHGAEKEAENNLRFTPLQVAALKCNKDAVVSLLKYGADYKLQTAQKETIVHLMCRGMWSRILNINDELNAEVLNSVSADATDSQHNFCNDLEMEKRKKTEVLRQKIFPLLSLLLDLFKSNKDVMSVEDAWNTSPGTIMHYFACLNFVDGAKTLLKEPYSIYPSTFNKNKMTPLWIASYYNHTDFGRLLLEYNANPNDCGPVQSRSPLHNAIYGFHIKRVDDTCDFIDALLEHGADPKHMDDAGETPVHLATGTQEFRVS